MYPHRDGNDRIELPLDIALRSPDQISSSEEIKTSGENHKRIV